MMVMGLRSYLPSKDENIRVGMKQRRGTVCVASMTHGLFRGQNVTKMTEDSHNAIATMKNTTNSETTHDTTTTELVIGDSSTVLTTAKYLSTNLTSPLL
jgi:hypothetical protein